MYDMNQSAHLSGMAAAFAPPSLLFYSIQYIYIYIQIAL